MVQSVSVQRSKMPFVKSYFNLISQILIQVADIDNCFRALHVYIIIIYMIGQETSILHNCLQLQMVTSGRSPSSLLNCLLIAAVPCIEAYFTIFTGLFWMHCSLAFTPGLFQLLFEYCISAIQLLASAVELSPTSVSSTVGPTLLFEKYWSRLKKKLAKSYLLSWQF